jgi:hypothetical protein
MRAWQPVAALLLLAACSQHGHASIGSSDGSGVGGRKLAAEAAMGQQLVTAGEPGQLRRSPAVAAAPLSPEAALEEEIKRRWARRFGCLGSSEGPRDRAQAAWRSLDACELDRCRDRSRRRCCWQAPAGDHS